MLTRLSITAQVMLLAALATLLASGAMALVALRGPPTRAMPWDVSELARAIDGKPHRTRDKRPLYRSTSSTRPSAPSDLTPDPALARMLERTAGLPQGQLALYDEAPPRRPSQPGAEAPAHSPGDRFHPALVPGRFVVIRSPPRGGYIVWRTGRDPALARWQLVTVATVIAVLGAILLLTWLIARRITRPIFDLARAARRARAGEAPAFSIPGATPEVYDAARAMADLQQRNIDHAQGRLTMLGAIAHDLGTPLARLAFRVEKLDEAGREAAQGDIAAMHAMIADSLTMARGWDGHSKPVDLAEICASIADAGQDMGHAASYAGPAELVLTGHAVLLHRMVQNLTDNALRYGHRARLTLRREGMYAYLAVEDDGPGFPDLPQAELLRPFVRGENSRNNATGGSGLGLAIVAQVVERHGGSMELGRAKRGGALATVKLPLDR